ncbi:TolC family protein [Paraburkholderia sp. J8-2]|uniref:TolC family protein n=1 Tax=Paraburkholderia sp. J8-2 TaxID=2805440 RepID=UPI002AB65E13|nr:TolC family protein [Paraburkholderia sp. J8-2]
MIRPRYPSPHSSTLRVCALCLAAALAGCTSLIKVDVPPQRDVPSAFSQVPSPRDASPDLANWWRTWQDPELTGYVEAALRANDDLRIAQARVREARAIAAMADSARYPSLSAQAGAAHGFGSLSTPSTLAPDDTPDVDAWAGGATAIWEVDLFGRRASDAEAASAMADASAEQLRGTRIAIAGEVAQNYLTARGLQRRLAVLDRSLDALHALRRYADARFTAGQATRYDLGRVDDQIARQEAQRPLLVSEIAVRERRLAVLTGRTAQDATPLGPPLALEIPAVPSGEIPSSVLERRPDVRASAALVRAQAARLGSAKADLFPRFYLTFIGLDGHVHLDGFPGLSAAGGLIGVGADLPIFNAGRLRANVSANDARLQAALAQHDKTLLQALEEVDDAYGLRHGFDARSARLGASFDLARRNVQSARELYEGGQRTLQDVLDARIDALQREDALAQAQTDAALATVKLYLALGGGWARDDDPTAAVAN